MQEQRLTIVGCRGDLLQHRHSVVTRPADAMFQVALRVAWATVEMIAAAHGLDMIKTSAHGKYLLTLFKHRNATNSYI